MKLVIIVAMDRERQQLEQLFAGNADVVIAQCGIGKVNAAAGTADLITRHHPDMVISTGCAGGHGPGVRVQDVVVSTELCYHDVYCGLAEDGRPLLGQVQGMPARFKADAHMLAVARQLKEGECGVTVHEGLMVTGDWFVDSREKMQQIVTLFPEARAVDMESAAIAQVCHIRQVPFISFRVISDVPLSDENASQYHNFWSELADRSFHITERFVNGLLAE